MKYWFLITLLVLFILIALLGWAMGIMHWPYHRLVYYGGISGTIVFLLLIGLKISRGRKKNKF